ncbi:hypothetical protein MLD38_011900 [Melastoma candidum]|uniref:Uncharacterized protein n=1 Tax=Melastoma candidum TaxID=119954 RepID=A0ACB9R464_9MYRT|nr:hypothetical protein MLD38_011900 [Melastoma candidum]
MAKFLALILTLACVVGSVQCRRPFWEMIWPPLLPSPPPSLPQSPNSTDGSFGLPPSSYDHPNTPTSPLPSAAVRDVLSLSPSPSSYDNRVQAGQPPSSPSRPLLSSSPVTLPSSPPSSDDSGSQTNKLPQAPAPFQALFNVLHYGAKGNGRDDDSQVRSPYSALSVKFLFDH